MVTRCRENLSSGEKRAAQINDYQYTAMQAYRLEIDIRRDEPGCADLVMRPVGVIF